MQQTMRPLCVIALLMAPWAASDAARASGAGAPETGRFDPAYADIPALRAALDEHRITSEELVRYYLDRIDRLDKRGPRINALITVNPNALEDARRADREAGSAKGLLHGIPFIAKDNYDSLGLPTSGGSAALESSVPPRNAFVVQKLLDRGAILLAKANMSELAASYGRLGYSSAGGLTLNPYNTARTASGSSSGSAAAVAADFAPFALGTDTTGSIRGPASAAGLVGLRPTLGLTSRGGVVPLSLSADTTGALTRSVADQAIILDAIAGPDPADAATAYQPRFAAAYAEPLLEGARHASLRGVRLGVVRNFRGGNAEVDAAEQAALDTLRAEGAVLVPLTLPADFENLWDLVLGPVGEAEFKPQFERYLGALAQGTPKTLAQLIEICESPAVRDSATPVNPARLDALRKADSTGLTDSPAYIRILTDVIPYVRRQLVGIASRERLQAFVFATMSCPAAPRYDREDASYVCRSDDPYKATYIAAAAGFPEISVPMGVVRARVPIGFSFLGLPYSEKRLLLLARAFERAAPRVAPPAELQGAIATN
jgi:amidase